jgi:hypothetical protein
MALTSLQITRKIFQDVYSPKVDLFTTMISSINSPMGFGQNIESYVGTKVLRTYYHYYDYSRQEIVVLDIISGEKYTPLDAGPNLWNVSSELGVLFLNGSASISGLRKFKYCNGCTDRNTINFDSVVNFEKRFTQVGSLMEEYQTLDAYLFYDFTLPRFSNVFPATKQDDGVNVTFRFKTIDGVNKTVSEISTLTEIPVLDIEDTIDQSEPLKPIEGANSIIVSCCDEKLYHVVAGQMKVGATATSSSYFDGSKSWYVESYTNDESTIPRGITFTYGERSCKSGIINNPCGGLPTSSILRSCCSAPTLIIDGVYAIGTVLYTKDVSPAICYQVTDNTTDSPTSYYRFVEFRGDCKTCSNSYPGGCK